MKNPDAPKKSRDKEKTRAHILETGFKEIYHHGFQGVSIRDIVAKTEGLTIGAFFHHFPTKQALVYAIVEEYLQTGIMARWITPLNDYENPVDGIIAQFKNTFDTWPDEYVARGCPLNNLIQEMSTLDAVFHEKARALIQEWIDETDKQLKRAQQNGFLQEQVDTQQLAEFIVTMQEGTFGIGKALNNRKIFGSLYLSFKEYLQSKT